MRYLVLTFRRLLAKPAPDSVSPFVKQCQLYVYSLCEMLGSLLIANVTYRAGNGYYNEIIIKSYI